MNFIDVLISKLHPHESIARYYQRIVDSYPEARQQHAQEMIRRLNTAFDYRAGEHLRSIRSKEIPEDMAQQLKDIGSKALSNGEFHPGSLTYDDLYTIHIAIYALLEKDYPYKNSTALAEHCGNRTPQSPVDISKYNEFSAYPLVIKLLHPFDKEAGDLSTNILIYVPVAYASKNSDQRPIEKAMAMAIYTKITSAGLPLKNPEY